LVILLASRTVARVFRYLALTGGAAVIGYAAFLLLPGRSVLERLSTATAYASLFLLAAALMIGPLNVLRSKPNPLSSYLRRDVGIVAGTLAVAHVALGLQAHMDGDFVQYFFNRHDDGRLGDLRLDAFGITNHIGLLATLMFLVLLSISSNAAMRSLRPQRWKTLQRWTYATALLVIVHGFIYQALEKQTWVLVAVVVVATLTIATLQGLGFRRKKKFDSAEARSSQGG
jgi:sulfoxide reductase heme-binding subunit YedZ